MTPRQQLFVGYFLRYAEGKRAALAVGVGYESAASMASQWLALPEVADAVKAGQARLLDEHIATAAEVIRETRRLAMYDATRFVGVRVHRCEWCWCEFDGPTEERPDDPDPDCVRCWGAGTETIVLTDTRDLTPAERAPIEGISEGREGLKVKLASKVQALALLAKLMGMDKDQAPAGEPVNIIINGVQLAPLQGKKP